MVSFEAFFKVLTTVFAFIEGISNQIVPLFHKALDKRPAPVTQPVANPYCDPPYCGTKPYFCPEEKLSQPCLHRKMMADFETSHRTTPLPNIKDDDNENKDKFLSLSSPSSIIMLVFGLAIVLAIIGFFYIRFNQRNNNNNRLINDERQSSIGSI